MTCDLTWDFGLEYYKNGRIYNERERQDSFINFNSQTLTMLSTKHHRGKSSRMRELRDDLSIILGVKRSRYMAENSSNSEVLNHSQYWSHLVELHGDKKENQNQASQSESPKSESGNTRPVCDSITISSVPQLVTASQRRTPSATKFPRRSQPGSTWGICSSRAIYRPSTTPPGMQTPSRP